MILLKQGEGKQEKVRLALLCAALTSTPCLPVRLGVVRGAHVHAVLRARFPQMGGNSSKPEPLTAMQRPIAFGKLMGSWYLIAHIPVFIEKNAHNAIESYEWEPDKKRFIVHYEFNGARRTGCALAPNELAARPGRSAHACPSLFLRSPPAEKALDGPHVDTYQRAYIHNHQTFTEMRITPKLPVVGYTPLRFPYLITHMADDYSHIIVGYPSREYLWIMARSPTLPPAQYDMLVSISKAQGYKTELIRKVPQDPTRPVFKVPTVALP